MDDLKITIDTLSADDRREFLIFIKKQGRRKDRKDAALFQLLMQKKSFNPQELQERLYPEADNTMAYYALRKRLFKQLSDFILLKRVEEDNTAASSVMGMLSLAKYLFEVKVERLAWNLLRKAEKTAAENEQYDLLNSIYNLQIEKAESEYAPDLHQIIRNRNENKIAADEDERANIAASLIRQQLKLVQAQGLDLNFDVIIRNVLQEFKLREAVSKRPSLFYKLMTIARSAVLARKDYYQFEPYIIAQYRQVEAQNGFARRHLFYKLNLLYMIAHVLYRTRKFNQSIQYLDQLLHDMETDPKGLYLQFYPRFIFLKSANLAFLRRLEEATELMEELQQKQGLVLNLRDQLTASIGLSFFYFAQEKYTKANIILMRLPHSDKFCEKTMGKEWVLKKNLGELIIMIEQQSPELAINKIRHIERNYKKLLQQQAYRNAWGFLQLLKQLLDQPQLIAQNGFMEMVEQQLEFGPLEQEDLPAMSFYAWIKSKMIQRPYYDVLLELSSGKIPEPEMA